MEVALYLLPVTLGDTAIEKVLPSYNREIIVNIKHFIVEDVRSARRFLKKVDADICIDELTFYPLNFLSVEQAYFSRSYIGLSCSACRGTLHGSYF